MLTEFGGIALSRDTDRTWGYSRSADAEEFARRYKDLMAAVRSLSVLAGFCYTQFTDTFQETNGLLYFDREPKIPMEDIALATRGVRAERDIQRERDARERVMELLRDEPGLIHEEGPGLKAAMSAASVNATMQPPDPGMT